MRLSPGWTRGGLVLLVGIGSLCLSSCSSVRTHPFDDYVGPQQDPAAFRQAVQESARSQAEAATMPSASMPATAPAETGPLQLTVQDAILMALQNNAQLIVQRYNPAIARTAEQVARAEFDPVLSAAASYNRTRTTLPGHPLGSVLQNWSDLVSVSEFLPTGTTLALTGGSTITDDPVIADQRFQTNVNATITQSLLQGFGIDVNLATIRQACIDTLISQYELRGVAESLVADTEEAFYDYVLALRQIEIFQQSLEVAQKQLDDTKARVRVGQLAPSELPAAEAEVALRHEDLIAANGAMATAQLKLLQLLNPPGLFNRELVVDKVPALPEVDLADPEAHVQVGLKYRPDLNEARLRVNRGDLEIVKTKNGLLPKLDLFVTLGRTGYADSLCQSIQNLNNRNYEVLAGLNFQYPLGNRAAEATYHRSLLTRDQGIEAVGNLAQLVELDVRDAYITVTTTREQVTATAATEKLQAEKLRAETERFRVGKSTTLLVGIAQRDLLNSQIAEVQARVAYVKSLVELYRLEGSLLQRRGIASPGDKPVEIPARDVTKFRPPPGA